MNGYKYIPVLFSAFMLLGCIRDDGSGLDCDRTRISFCYFGDAPGSACRLVEKTDNVTLYVYDSDARLVMECTKSNADLRQYKGINLNLPDGDYTLVAWTNLTPKSQVNDTERLPDATVGCADYYSGQPVIGHENDRVYYATKQITVVQSEFRNEEMQFSQAHIPLHIHVTGVAAPTRASVPVEVDLVNLHPQMGFDGTSTRNLKTVYRAPLAYDGQTGDYTACVYAFRFPDDNDIELRLSASGGGECYKSVTLTDFMSEHSISVEDKDEAEIALRFRFNNNSVEITPWEEEDIDPTQK